MSNEARDNSGEEAPPEFVAAFARGLRVICAFGADADRLTLTDVASRAGLTRAGARRLLITLEHLGYVGRTGRYFFLTPKVLSLGFAYTASMPLFPFAAQVLERLVEEVSESVSLVVLDDTEIVFVFSFPFKPLFTMAFTAGSRLPAHSTSAGRLLLGQLAPEELKDYFRRARLEKLTSKTETDPKLLEEIIRRDSAQGWSIVEGEVAEHISGIAVPILNPLGKAVAAANVSFAGASLTRSQVLKRILPALQRASRQVSFSLDMKNRTRFPLTDKPML